MNFRRQVAKRVLLLLMILVVSGTTLAATESPSVFTNEIPNYRDYSDTLSSPGQPLETAISKTYTFMGWNWLRSDYLSCTDDQQHSDSEGIRACCRRFFKIQPAKI